MSDETTRGDGDTPATQRRRVVLRPDIAARLRQPRVALSWALTLAGAIALVAGWWGVSGTLDVGRQLAYVVSGGIGGVFLLGLSAALLFSGDLSENTRQVARLEGRIDELTMAVQELAVKIARDSVPQPEEPAAVTNGAVPSRPRARRG